MVVIRLSRGGAKARPFFNIVVADKRTRRDGRFIERIGFYSPIATDKEESLRIAQDRLTYWKGVGRVADVGGVRGWLKVTPHSAPPEAFFSSRRWFLQPSDKGPPAFAGTA